MSTIEGGIPLPSRYPEVEVGSELQLLLSRQVDSQFADLAMLMELPRPDLGFDSGGNLTAAGLICNITSGASVLFYEGSIAAIKNKTNGTNPWGSGERFKRVLRDHLPWAHMGDEPLEDVVDLLYTFTRNPLAHSLGIGKSGHVAGFQGKDVLMQKPCHGLPRPAVAALMRGEEEPPEDRAPVVKQTENAYVVDVPGLAWATCRLVRHLLRDPVQRPKSIALANQLAHGIYDPHGPVGEDEESDTAAAVNSASTHTERGFHGVGSAAMPPTNREERSGQ